LITAAVAAGAEFRDGFSVDEYLTDGETVTGIRGRSSGAQITEQAQITVGADGRNSFLARTVRAPAYENTRPLTCWYFSYWSDAALDGLEMYLRDRNVVFAFPTNDGLAAIFIAWDVREFARVRQNIAGSFMNVLERVPDLGHRIRSGRREERFYGTADLPTFFRKPYGLGWALVGDAGHHKDPFMALGICDALRDAELLASAIDDGLSGRQCLPDALADYERKRNVAAMEFHQENLDRARFKPVPEDLLAIRAAVRGRQEETNRFYMAQQGMIPPDEFFNTDNLRRLMARAGAGATRIEAVQWPLCGTVSAPSLDAL
jgi:flavin-dependent dehydrogenase